MLFRSILFLQSTLFICADFAVRQEKIISQRQLINLSIQSFDPDLTAGALLTNNADDAPDECKWRGIQCIEDFICSVFYDTLHGARFHIKWFPPNVRHIHLSSVYSATAWTTRHLPRKLRFFCITNTRHPFHFLDMRRLPAALEEFIFSTPNVYGALDLRDLPGTLELIHIACSIKAFPQPILYDPDVLPKSLRNAFFLRPANKKPRKLTPLGSGETRTEFHTSFIDEFGRKSWLLENSRYYRKFAEQVAFTDAGDDAMLWV